MELSVHVETWQSFGQPWDGSLGKISGREDDVPDFYKQISSFVRSIETCEGST